MTAALALACALGAGSARADVGEFFERLLGNITTTWVSFDTPSGEVKIKIRGKIEFTPGEDDVQSLGGRAVFQEKRDGHTQRMVVEMVDGGLVHTYSLDGQEQAPDAAAKRWFTDIIAEFLLETGRNAEARVQRVYTQGGAAAVLADIARVHSDRTRSRYVRALAQAYPLDDKSLQELVLQVSRMDSDHERRTALTAIVDKQNLTPACQVAVLSAIAKMDSSFEQRQVMVALTSKLAADAQVSEAWLAAAKQIDSDYELRAVIEAMAKREALTPAQLNLAIEATLNLDSDYEQAVALKALLRHLPQAGRDQVAAYLRCAAKIDSSYEKSQVLQALIKQVKLDKEGFVGVLQTADTLDSDYEKGRVLVALAGKMPADTELLARYRKSARKLGDYERGQAEKALDRLTM